VRLVHAEELARIQAAAKELGVSHAVDNGFLRQTEDGRCVFLDEQQLCRIHAVLGASVKPLICQQYPLVTLNTERGERTGIDPGCYSAFATRSSGDPIEAGREIAQRRVHFEGHITQMEDILLGLLTLPGQSVEGAIGRLAGGGPGLPSGFVERLVAALQAEGIQRACTHPSAGPSVRAGLAPMVEALPGWACEGVPDSDWHPEMTQWGLEMSRRMVWLRLCPELPSPMVVALLSLCGALVAQWAHGQESSGYATTLAAWSRAMRRPLFWGSLLPDPTALQQLLRGP
jgi:Fe-S-cluster containining protein